MKKLILFLLILFSISHSFAQEEKISEKEKARREKNIQAGNPFKRFGYKPKIATLSKGKYLEFHDLDSIVRIGSFTYNVKRKKLIGYTKLDTVHPESTLRPEIISRWFSPDPLSDEFPSWSPYSFVYNNPVRFIDPDGQAAEDIVIIYKENGVNKSWTYTGNNGGEAPDNAFISSVLEAACYNKLGIEGQPLQKLAENRDLKVGIIETENGSMFRQAKNTIYWNPNLGSDNNGVVRSPSSILEHEADHALEYNTNQSNYIKGLNTKDKNFDNKEEKRVITGSEQVTAFANGEISKNQITRSNHEGNGVITNGVTSNKINKEKTQKHYQQLNNAGYRVDKQLKKYKP